MPKKQQSKRSQNDPWAGSKSAGKWRRQKGSGEWIDVRNRMPKQQEKVLIFIRAEQLGLIPRRPGV